MSEILQFTIATNMAHNQGEVSGYFAVQSGISISGAVSECLNVIEERKLPLKCLPIVYDEFGLGNALTNFLQDHEQFAGIFTFGTDEDGHPLIQRPYSHVETIVHEIGQLRPDFLGAQLNLPEGKKNWKWREERPLEHLHLRLGTVIVDSNICTISLTDERL